MLNSHVKIVKSEVLSDNWYVLRKVTFDFLGKNGRWTTVSREAYDRGNGAVILLYNIDQKTVILTRQFRMPTYLNGNDTGMLIEACAGLLDRDNAEDCIRRETEEETGYQLQKIRKVYEADMSPGSVTEILYFFIAEYTPSMKIGEGGGAAHENEDIEVMEVQLEEAFRMIRNGQIKDAKTIMLLQFLRLEGIM